MATTTDKLKNDSSIWLSNIGVVNLGKSFKAYKEIVDFVVEDVELDMTSEAKDNIHYQNMKKLISEGLQKFPQPARHMDTSIGGCDVFNPYWQFGVDDDIIHPSHDIGIGTEYGPGMIGMGSIYSKMIYDNQKILWLSFGVPRFSKLKDFFLGDGNSVTGLMRDGEFSIMNMIGSLIGSAISLAWKIPLSPFYVSNWIGELLTKDLATTKYYDFKNSMLLYFRLVNGMLSILAVSMGLWGNHPGDGTVADASAIGPQHRMAEERRQLAEYATRELSTGYGWRSRVSVPEIMKDGPNIFKIINKRNRRMFDFPPTGGMDDLEFLMKKQAEMTEEEKKKGNEWFGACMSGIKDGLYGSNNFIGFRIEKNADASESLSNSVGEPEIAQSLNSVISQQRNLAFKMAGGEIGLGLFDKVIDGAQNFWEGAMSGAGLNSIANTITGNGYWDIPNEWKNSEFSKNHSFTIPLRARYGDPVTIFQCLYLPLCLILAGSMPRSVGSNMYTTPFLVQGFCKGLFSVPLGMFTNVNIKRGGAEFGWSTAHLPLSIDIDVELKDLSPAMFLSLTANESGLFSLIQRNTSMLDYLSTLSGLGLYSKNTRLHNFYRNKMSSFLRIKNTLFDPYFIGYMVGDNLGILKGIVQMTPFKNRPERHPSLAN